MYTSVKSCSGRSRRGRYSAFFIVSWLAFSFFGLTPDAAAQQLNLSVERTEADELDSGAQSYTVSVTATSPPGQTLGGQDRIYRFHYRVGGTATHGPDYYFNEHGRTIDIRGSATTHHSTLSINGDRVSEADETVVIKIVKDVRHELASMLSSMVLFPASLSIGTDTITFTIRNDDEDDSSGSKDIGAGNHNFETGSNSTLGNYTPAVSDEDENQGHE
ncbi:MAG: hypothetical protein OXE03_06985 [Gammaproteobacteria bacterium]|nr:hypothetical protein [Gammaproteobacteria bacterium]